MRVSREFRIFTNVLSSIVDPRPSTRKSFVEYEGDVCIVPPNSFALSRSVEYFRIPRNVLTLTVGKSTYARCGIITNVTPFEPEWEGYVTLEISQHHAAAGEDLRQRGHRPGVLLRGGRAARGQLRRQEGEVPGAGRASRCRDSDAARAAGRGRRPRTGASGMPGRCRHPKGYRAPPTGSRWAFPRSAHTGFVSSTSLPVLPLPTAASSPLATRPSAARRPCGRCELLPGGTPTSGDLHCWFPAPHVEAKARSLLRALGVSLSESVAGGVRVRFAEGERDLIAEALHDGLSAMERLDTRALLCAAEVAPAATDLARVEPLSRLLVRARSGWLLAMLHERRMTSHFQPIVFAAEPQRVHGHEALLRGVMPDGTLLAPARLFDTARDAGLLFQLDLAARRSAIAQAASHGLQGALFVNFAPTAIYDPTSCLRSTVALIDESGFDRAQVVFEIVETERAHDPVHLRRILDYYREAGFRIALDDVGAGYSSLNLIHLLRPDLLKLDMELIRGVDRDPYKARIAANLLDVATTLGIESLAEGIETEEELAWVQAHGATFAQGYLIARPSPEPRRG